MTGMVFCNVCQKTSGTHFFNPVCHVCIHSSVLLSNWWVFAHHFWMHERIVNCAVCPRQILVKRDKWGQMFVKLCASVHGYLTNTSNVQVVHWPCLISCTHYSLEHVKSMLVLQCEYCECTHLDIDMIKICRPAPILILIELTVVAPCTTS